MGQRLESDIEYYENEAKQMKLTEDGFCNACKEFHSDCFCIGFWVRKSKETREYMRANEARFIRDAKEELAFKDKRIKVLEDEITRIYDPIKKFWNEDMEKKVEMLQRKVVIAECAFHKIITSDHNLEEAERSAKDAISLWEKEV